MDGLWTVRGEVREDVDRLNGFLSTGYGEVGSSWGTGGASLFFPLLKAFRIEAKEGFLLMKPVPGVAIDDWEEWPKGVPGLLGNLVVAEPAESADALESPRVW